MALSGRIAVGDVARREVGGGLYGLVADRDLVVLLVALADAHEDLDGLLERRLLDHDRLEAALERRVALDVLAVLVEGGRADALQLAARERRLQDVGGIDRAFGRARADQRVELVDEEDGVVRVAELLDDLLEPLLELAAVLRPGHERADVEGQDALVQQRVRDVAGDDALRQPLDDGGLAHARLADERRVVLRAARPRIWMTRSISFSRPMTGSSLSGSSGIGEIDARAGRRSASCWRASSPGRTARRTSSATGRG